MSRSATTAAIYRITARDSTEAVTAARDTRATGMSSTARARHVTSVKVFAAILVIFILSYLPTILVINQIFDNFYIAYLYFINHIGNPVAYYVINRQFRSDVNKLIRSFY